MMQIKLLAECREHIPALAQLWFDELGKIWIPQASVEKAVANLEEHVNLHTLPLTFVALDANTPIGMVSLRKDNGLGDALTPWLDSLIVDAKYRRRGVGEGLINIIKQCALHMGYARLYLFALDPKIPEWYKKLGWEEIDKNTFHLHPATLMAINL